MSRRVVRRAGPRRRMIWARQAVNISGVVGGGTATADLLDTYLLSPASIGVGLTVTRVIMHATVFSDTLAALPATADGLLGGLVVSERVTPPLPPTPVANGGADWMDYYWYRAYGPPGVGFANLAAGAELFSTYDRDIHAQRRIDELGQSLFWTFTNTGISTMTLRAYVSTLLKLP